MQVDQHITTCPLLNQNAGLEPYPQPSIVFSAAVSGTAQVRIYDVSVQPMVELTSGALSGAELTSPTLTGLSNNYVLDMGHANVRAVVDCMTREGLECIVMFEDNGGTGEQRFVRVSCNTPEQVDLLYPDGAIYAKKGSGNSGTSFPNGSIYQKVDDLGDASHLVANRGAKILDVTNCSYDQTGDITNAKIGSRLTNITIRETDAGQFRVRNSEQVDFNGTTFLGPSRRSFGIRLFDTARFIGQVTFQQCQIKNVYCRNDAGLGRRYSVLRFIDCDINDGTVGAYQGNQLFSMEIFSCDFKAGTSTSFVDCDGIEVSDVTVFSPSGDFTIENVSNAAGEPSSVTMDQCRGSGAVTLASSVHDATINIGGVYNSITGGGSNVTINEKQLAHRSNLTQGITTLAAGSITSTQAPNLDAAISTRSTFNAAADSVTVGTNNDKTGYAMAGTLQSLDALDTAQDTQHAQTQADIAALTIPTAAQNADAVWDEAYAAHTSAGSFGKLMDTLRKANFLIEGTVNGTPTASAFDTTLTEVTGAHDSQIVLFTSGTLLGESRPIDTYNNTNGRLVLQEALTAAPSASDEFVVLPHHVHSISEIQNGLATSSALATVDANVDSLLVRLGADDVAIVKGLLLGNYVLDGGSGNTSAQYDSNGVMTAGRVRVFASSAAASGATLGAANGADSEIARVDVTASAVAGKAYPATVTGLLT